MNNEDNMRIAALMEDFADVEWGVVKAEEPVIWKNNNRGLTLYLVRMFVIALACAAYLVWRLVLFISHPTSVRFDGWMALNIFAVIAGIICVLFSIPSYKIKIKNRHRVCPTCGSAGMVGIGTQDLDVLDRDQGRIRQSTYRINECKTCGSLHREFFEFNSPYWL
ncbi:MAG: hypothetical protein LBN10_00160 [Propionibacteriaceae bacterium]|jgi:ribosomal protein L32|nr:hypothetical protein [Propionibacteriaceae bacterium]